MIGKVNFTSKVPLEKHFNKKALQAEKKLADIIDEEDTKLIKKNKTAAQNHEYISQDAYFGDFSKKIEQNDKYIDSYVKSHSNINNVDQNKTSNDIIPENSVNFIA